MAKRHGTFAGEQVRVFNDRDVTWVRVNYWPLNELHRFLRLTLLKKC